MRAKGLAKCPIIFRTGIKEGMALMGDKPLISLLVPIYNVERYLSTCLDSAVSQTLSDIEIICINDGSTDASLSIIEDFAKRDDRIRVIDKSNSGYGASMNKGIDVANGEFIGILESDDFFEPDALEVLYSAAIEADVDVAKADFFFYWSKPEEKDERFGWVDAGAPKVAVPMDYPEVFYRKPSIWSAIYRRSFLEKNGIRFLETPGASYQDTSFNFKVWACASRVALINRAVLHYRQDNESSSINSPGKAFCVCDEYGEMERFVSSLPQSDEKERLLRILVRLRFDTYMWNYERLSEPLQLGFLQTMRETFSDENDRGLLDTSLFDEGKLEKRDLAINHPDLFHLRCSRYASRGKLDTLKRYYKAGGLTAIVGVLADRFSR